MLHHALPSAGLLHCTFEVLSEFILKQEPLYFNDTKKKKMLQKKRLFVHIIFRSYNHEYSLASHNIYSTVLKSKPNK